MSLDLLGEAPACGSLDLKSGTLPLSNCSLPGEWCGRASVYSSSAPMPL